MVQSPPRRRTSAVLIVALVFLSAVTLSLGAVAAHGFFVTGWLLPYWTAMTEAQASIISQLIFFLAVAWGSLLVPLLFGGQLRSLEAAATEAQNTFSEIKQQMEDSAADSRRQFASISRYHQRSLGFFSGNAVFSDFDDEQKKEFVDAAWLEVEPGVTEALEHIHGKTRVWVSGGGRYRSAPWWERVKESGALGDLYAAHKTISDAKWGASRTPPSVDQLVAVNNALRALKEAKVHGGATPTSGPSQTNGGTPIIEGPTTTQ